jgi:uncharacterized membrane protein YwaF
MNLGCGNIDMSCKSFFATSLLDLLPPWPIYILYMEAIGMITVLLLYSPFAIKDWQAKVEENRANSSRLEGLSK